MRNNSFGYIWQLVFLSFFVSKDCVEIAGIFIFYYFRTACPVFILLSIL